MVTNQPEGGGGEAMKVDLANLELVTVDGKVALLLRLDRELGDELPVLERSRRRYTLTLPDEDPIRQFLRDCVRADAKGRVRALQMTAAYLDWCQKSGAVPTGRVSFARGMRAIGYRTKHSNGSWWLGLTLKDAAPSEDEGRQATLEL